MTRARCTFSAPLPAIYAFSPSVGQIEQDIEVEVPDNGTINVTFELRR
jgi:hypothetical protein